MNISFLSSSCCKQFCVCLRLPANTCSFYLQTINFSVYSLCKQVKSKFSTPPQKNNGLSLTDVLLLDLVEVPFCVLLLLLLLLFFLYSEVLSPKSLPFLLKYNFSHCFGGFWYTTFPLTAYQRPVCGHN